MRKPIKLNETITQNDVDFALKNLGAVIDAIKIEDKTQIELTAICRGEKEYNQHSMFFFVKMKDGTFRAADITNGRIFGVWAKDPDFVWPHGEIKRIVKFEQIADVTILGDREIDEGLIKKAASAVVTGVKRAGEKIADTVKGAAGAVHDTFAANDAVKQLVAQVGKAKKAGKDPQFWIKTGKGEFALNAVTLSKNKKALILVTDGKSKDGVTVDGVTAALAGAGITKKITNAIDSVQIGLIDKVVDNFPEGFSEKAKDINGDEFNRIKGKIEAVKFDDGADRIILKLGETRAEQHDREDNDLWS